MVHLAPRKRDMATKEHEKPSKKRKNESGHRVQKKQKKVPEQSPIHGLAAAFLDTLSDAADEQNAHVVALEQAAWDALSRLTIGDIDIRAKFSAANNAIRETFRLPTNLRSAVEELAEFIVAAEEEFTRLLARLQEIDREVGELCGSHNWNDMASYSNPTDEDGVGEAIEGTLRPREDEEAKERQWDTIIMEIKVLGNRAVRKMAETDKKLSEKEMQEKTLALGSLL